jgi:hypothetical protein
MRLSTPPPTSVLRTSTPPMSTCGGHLLGRRTFLLGAAATVAAAIAGVPHGTSSASTIARVATGSAGALTGPVPPAVRVTSARHDPRSFLFFTTNGATDEPGLMIVDDRGQVVWYRTTGDPNRATANLRVQQYRGRPVLTWWEGMVTNGVGDGEYVVLDDAYAELTRVQAGNGLAGDLHEFLLTPQGTALLIAYRALPAGAAKGQLNPLLEAVVQEVEIGTGRVRFEWHSADQVTAEESYATPPADATQPFEYFHANANVVIDRNVLLISARNTWTVYRVSRRSGAVVWRMGGKRSDFTHGAGAQYEWQHDARWHAGGQVSLFDNGADPVVEPESRGLVLDVDEQHRQVTLAREYRHPAKPSAGSQGNVQLLADGGAMVGWGAQPYATQFDADGKIVVDGRLPDGVYSYRALRFGWPAPAAATAAVLAKRAASGTGPGSASTPSSAPSSTPPSPSTPSS